MKPHIDANQSRNGIYLASQKEVEEIKSKYIWWYEITANSIGPLLCYRENKPTTA